MILRCCKASTGTFNTAKCSVSLCGGTGWLLLGGLGLGQFGSSGRLPLATVVFPDAYAMFSVSEKRRSCVPSLVGNGFSTFSWHAGHIFLDMFVAGGHPPGLALFNSAGVGTPRWPRLLCQLRLIV